MRLLRREGLSVEPFHCSGRLRSKRGFGRGGAEWTNEGEGGVEGSIAAIAPRSGPPWPSVRPCRHSSLGRVRPRVVDLSTYQVT